MAERFKVEFRMNPTPEVLARGFFAAKHRLENLSDPLRDAVEVLANEIAQNFAAEGRPPWDELAESTIEKRGSAHPILDDSGDLVAAATGTDAWNIEQIPRGARAGMDGDTLPEYWYFHITGTMNMPVRDFLTVSEAALNEIEEIFADYAESTVKTALGAT